jgi:hypothetical protein
MIGAAPGGGWSALTTVSRRATSRTHMEAAFEKSTHMEAAFENINAS